MYICICTYVCLCVCMYMCEIKREKDRDRVTTRDRSFELVLSFQIARHTYFQTDSISFVLKKISRQLYGLTSISDRFLIGNVASPFRSIREMPNLLSSRSGKHRLARNVSYVVRETQRNLLTDGAKALRVNQYYSMHRCFGMYV